MELIDGEGQDSFGTGPESLDIALPGELIEIDIDDIDQGTTLESPEAYSEETSEAGESRDLASNPRSESKKGPIYRY